MINTIRYSIISMLELYRNRSKDWYQFSLTFFIISTILSLPASLLAGYLLHYKLNVNILFHDADVFSNALMIISNEYLRALQIGFIVMSAAVLSCYLFQVEFSEEKQQPGFNAFIGYVPARVLKGFLAYLLLLMLISIGFAWASEHLKYSVDFENQHSDSVNRSGLILNYVLNLQRALLILLPYLFGFVITLIYFEGHVNFEIFKRYRKTLFATIILGFLSFVIYSSVITVVDMYVTTLFQIVFSGTSIRLITGIVLNLILASYFFLILPSLFMYTVFYQFQNEQRQQKAGIENENQNTERNKEGEFELDAQ